VLIFGNDTDHGAVQRLKVGIKKLYVDRRAIRDSWSILQSALRRIRT